MAHGNTKSATFVHWNAGAGARLDQSRSIAAALRGRCTGGGA